MALSTIERVLFLRSVELFHQIHSEDLVAVAQVCDEVYLEPGERFITQGDPGNCLYIIVDGEAKVVLQDQGELYTRHSKDIIGEMAIVSKMPLNIAGDSET